MELEGVETGGNLDVRTYVGCRWHSKRRDGIGWDLGMERIGGNRTELGQLDGIGHWWGGRREFEEIWRNEEDLGTRGDSANPQGTGGRNWV